MLLRCTLVICACDIYAVVYRFTYGCVLQALRCREVMHTNHAQLSRRACTPYDMLDICVDSFPPFLIHLSSLLISHLSSFRIHLPSFPANPVPRFRRLPSSLSHTNASYFFFSCVGLQESVSQDKRPARYASLISQDPLARKLAEAASAIESSSLSAPDVHTDSHLASDSPPPPSDCLHDGVSASSFSARGLGRCE